MKRTIHFLPKKSRVVCLHVCVTILTVQFYISANKNVLQENVQKVLNSKIVRIAT